MNAFPSNFMGSNSLRLEISGWPLVTIGTTLCFMRWTRSISHIPSDIQASYPARFSRSRVSKSVIPIKNAASLRKDLISSSLISRKMMARVVLGEDDFLINISFFWSLDPWVCIIWFVFCMNMPPSYHDRGENARNYNWQIDILTINNHKSVDFWWFLDINRSTNFPPTPTNSYHLLPTPTISYQLLPTPTISYHLLPSPIISYHLLPSPTISYHLLPTPTNHLWTKSSGLTWHLDDPSLLSHRWMDIVIVHIVRLWRG